MAKRGKKYVEAKKKVESKTYSLQDGVEKALETVTVSFDPSVEIHMNLGIDPSKGDQLVRGTATLPHGTGKKVTVAAFVSDAKEKEVKDAGADVVGGENLINDIMKSGKCDFDVAVATPDMMKFIGKIAKILGPKGLMPSPKNETVTPDPAKVVSELKKGKVSFRNDSGANLHQAVGKASFGKDKIVENIETFVKVVQGLKPASSKGDYIKKITICTSMGPSVRIKM